MYIFRVFNGVRVNLLMAEDMRDVAFLANTLEKAKHSFKIIDASGCYMSPTDFGFGGFDYWLDQSTSFTPRE